MDVSCLRELVLDNTHCMINHLDKAERLEKVTVLGGDERAKRVVTVVHCPIFVDEETMDAANKFDFRSDSLKLLD